MNERIRELAIEAEIYAGEQIDEGADYNQYPRYYTEKFAELIVKECITVINSENYREHSEGWNSAIEWADGMIKEHFGVEE